MNAKKIMGAVLVALLAAALFVGAGAATEYDLGTVYTYTDLSGWTNGHFALGDEFTSADGTQTVVVIQDPTTSKYYFAENDVEAGTVFTGSTNNGQDIVTFKLSAPSAPVVALKNKVNIIGSTVSSVDGITFNAQTIVYHGITKLVFIDENGVVYEGVNGAVMPTNLQKPGKWGVAAVLTDANEYVGTAPVVGQVYYFTIADTAVSISAAVDTVYEGGKVIINVAAPGKSRVVISYDDTLVAWTQGQLSNDNTATHEVTVTLAADGTGSVAFDARDTGNAVFKIAAEDVEVSVTIKDGVITAVADEDYFYLGNPITLSGTTTTGADLYFYIEGTNFDFMRLTDSGLNKMVKESKVNKGEWTAELTSNNIKTSTKKLIAGTYTVIVSTNDGSNKPTDKTLKEYVMDGLYGTAAVTMTQPFITDVEAADTAIQGSKYVISGTAIAADGVKLYVFGTNYFMAAEDLSLDKEVFKFTIAATETAEMAPGTYFYLIQHPMNDKLFNVWNGTGVADKEAVAVVDDNDANFYYAPTGAVNETYIFNAWDRGTNYAAQALLDEISGQNIDDIFVQGTFEVAAQKVTINPIPAEVAKGTALTVSGKTNSGKGVEVIVNVLAGKFGATVKGDENAATFLTAKAVTKADGTFEAKIDTSKLELGNYIVTVEIDGTQYDTAAVSIVDKAPVTPPADDKPDTPVTPPADDKPTEPETPGFGALAALAGLGAVAVLLLRRE